jgi:hypothetical protein
MATYIGGDEQRKKPQSTFCECETLASLRYTYLGSFFLGPEDVKSAKVCGLSRTAVKEQGSLDWDYGEQSAPLNV